MANTFEEDKTPKRSLQDVKYSPSEILTMVVGYNGYENKFKID